MSSLTILLKKLASKNKEDRRSAAERLGQLGDTRAIRALKKTQALTLKDTIALELLSVLAASSLSVVRH